LLIYKVLPVSTGLVEISFCYGGSKWNSLPSHDVPCHPDSPRSRDDADWSMGICNEERARRRGCETVGQWGFASMREELFLRILSPRRKISFRFYVSCCRLLLRCTVHSVRHFAFASLMHISESAYISFHIKGAP
jgi:hypothetical protein